MMCGYPGQRVYPRVCGGTLPLHTAIRPLSGLSPRVRGNRRPPGQQHGPVGSIPACAGEPKSVGQSASCRRVYPRVCGGTSLASTPAEPETGLSPRVRGNPDPDALCAIAARSIPACAGEPTSQPTALKTRPVYPRVCGGTTPTGGTRANTGGLSPRVRGNPTYTVPFIYEGGSIPACAGEPQRERVATTDGAVYPRVCGGTLPISRLRLPMGGLSPRVRGNQQPGAVAVPQGRSIPACAGEPIK